MKKIYIIQHKKTMIIHGCFKTEEKAKNYVNGNIDYHIMPLKAE